MIDTLKRSIIPAFALAISLLALAMAARNPGWLWLLLFSLPVTWIA